MKVKLEVEMYEYHYCNCLVLDVYLLCLNRRFCLAVCWCILLVGHFLKQIIHDNSSLTSRRHDSVQCDCSDDTTQSCYLSIIQIKECQWSATRLWCSRRDRKHKTVRSEHVCNKCDACDGDSLSSQVETECDLWRWTLVALWPPNIHWNTTIEVTRQINMFSCWGTLVQSNETFITWRIMYRLYSVKTDIFKNAFFLVFFH